MTLTLFICFNFNSNIYPSHQASRGEILNWISVKIHLFQSRRHEGLLLA